MECKQPLLSEFCHSDTSDYADGKKKSEPAHFKLDIEGLIYVMKYPTFTLI